MSTTLLEKIHSQMTTKAVTSDEIKLANEIIASYLADSAAALKNAKDVARQSGVPFKFDIEGLVVAFDPDKEEAELEADRLQKEAEEEEGWCSSAEPEYETSWESSDDSC